MTYNLNELMSLPGYFKNTTQEEINRQLRYTPSYVVDLITLTRELQLLRQYIPSDAILSYSYKTNYLRPICNLLNQKGVLAEVVSPFEVDITKSYNILPHNIIYNGPIKDKSSIEYVLLGKGIVNADSYEELELIISLKRVMSLKTTKIGIRLNLGFIDKSLDSRFGINSDLSDLKKIQELLFRTDSKLHSLHTHIATRSISSFAAQTSALLKLIKDNKFLHDVSIIDLGGGIPSLMDKTLHDQIKPKPFDLNSFRDLLNDFLLEARKITSNQKLKLAIEPGTFLAANSLSLLGQVKSIKKREDHLLLTLNIGRNDIGGLKQNIQFPLIHKSNLVKNLSKASFCQLYGYSCVENDKLGCYYLTSPSVGDFIILSSVGSYSSVFKSPFIQGDLALYTYDGKKLNLDRYPQKATDVLYNYT